MKRGRFWRVIILLICINVVSCAGSLLEEGEVEDAQTSIRLRGIWVVGGLSSNSISATVNQVDMYDPETNTWHEAITTMPTPVSFAAVASVNGKIYVIGGFDSAGNLSTVNMEYDVVNDRWSYKSTVNLNFRANVHASVINDKIYVLGGNSAAYNVAWAGSTNTQCYDPAIDQWALGLTAFGAAGSERFSVSFSDVVYNFGGRITNGSTMINTHDGYSTVSDLLTTGVTEVALSSNRTAFASAVYSNATATSRMFIIGGITSFTGTPQCYLFSGPTNAVITNLFQYLNHPFSAPAAWTAGTVYPVNVANGSAAISGTTLYHFGGHNVYPPSGTAKVYSINAVTITNWTEMADMPTGRFGHRVVTINQ